MRTLAALLTIQKHRANEAARRTQRSLHAVQEAERGIDAATARLLQARSHREATERALDEKMRMERTRTIEIQEAQAILKRCQTRIEEEAGRLREARAQRDSCLHALVSARAAQHQADRKREKYREGASRTEAALQAIAEYREDAMLEDHRSILGGPA